MKSWLHDNGIKMYSTYNKQKCLVAERFIRNLENKIYMHMTTVSKHLYTDKLDKTVDKHTKTHHSIIKMKLANVKVDTYSDYGVEHNDRDLKFNVNDHVRISRYKNTFAKEYTAICDLNGEKIDGIFYKEMLQKTSQKEFRIEKVIKKVIDCMSGGRAMRTYSIAKLI